MLIYLVSNTLSVCSRVGPGGRCVGIRHAACESVHVCEQHLQVRDRPLPGPLQVDQTVTGPVCHWSGYRPLCAHSDDEWHLQLAYGTSTQGGAGALMCNLLDRDRLGHLMVSPRARKESLTRDPLVKNSFTRV